MSLCQHLLFLCHVLCLSDLVDFRFCPSVQCRSPDFLAESRSQFEVPSVSILPRGPYRSLSRNESNQFCRHIRSTRWTIREGARLPLAALLDYLYVHTAGHETHRLDGAYRLSCHLSTVELDLDLARGPGTAFGCGTVGADGFERAFMGDLFFPLVLRAGCQHAPDWWSGFRCCGPVLWKALSVIFCASLEFGVQNA